jgi:hypothetical protein
VNPITRAAEDIRYLLERGYPRQSAIRFVCDHYRINREERIILSRTVFDPVTAERRKSKTINCKHIKGKTLWIDGFNVLFAVETAFTSEPLFTCDDGFLRDVRGATRNYKITNTTLQALDAIISFLAQNSPAWVEFLFDAQISKSGELSSICREKLKSCKIKGEARTSTQVDFELKHTKHLVATSDGIIIDEADHVVNLPHCIFKQIKHQQAKHPTTNRT